MVPVAHNAIRAFKAATEDALGALGSSFGDSSRGKELVPANLNEAVQDVDHALASGYTHTLDKDYWTDAPADVISAAYLGAIKALRWWMDKARNLVASTEEACARFDRTEAKLREILATVEAKPDIAPAPEKPTLPVLQDPPPKPVTSYTSFDPREVMRNAEPKDDAPRVRPVGDGDGYHVGGGR